jgi:hypothetical protein
VKIKIGTLVLGPEIRTRAIVLQQKTARPVQFEASIIYKTTGNLRAVQILLGHTKIENTVRCANGIVALSQNSRLLGQFGRKKTKLCCRERNRIRMPTPSKQG